MRKLVFCRTSIHCSGQTSFKNSALSFELEEDLADELNKPTDDNIELADLSASPTNSSTTSSSSDDVNPNRSGKSSNCEVYIKLVSWSLGSSALFCLTTLALIECGARTTRTAATVNSSQSDAKPNDNNTTNSIEAPVQLASLLAHVSSLWLLLPYSIYLILESGCRRIKQRRSGSAQGSVVGDSTQQLRATHDLFISHSVVLLSDQPTLVKALFRCLLLTLPWQVFVNLLLRSLESVSPVNATLLLAVLPCFVYLLRWIVVHRRFCALRVIAFILASSGVILNIYASQENMSYRCLTSLAVIGLAMFKVLSERLLSKPSFVQSYAFLFGFGLFNLITCWIVVIITSVLTSFERIAWSRIRWSTFVGVGLSLLGLLLAYDLSSRKTKRFVQTCQPLLAALICAAYNVFWFKHRIKFSNTMIASLVLIVIATLLNAVPNKLLKAITRLLRQRRLHKAQQPSTTPLTKRPLESMRRTLSFRTTINPNTTPSAPVVGIDQSSSTSVGGQQVVGQTASSCETPRHRASLQLRPNGYPPGSFPQSPQPISSSAATSGGPLGVVQVAVTSSSGGGGGVVSGNAAANRARSRFGSALLKAAASASLNT